MISPHSPRSRRFVLVGLLLLVITAVGSLTAARVTAQNNTWVANYWNSPDFTGPVVAQRIETWPSYNWGTGSPIPGIVAEDEFSVQWTSSQEFAPGYYRFTVTADDGVRLWVNNYLIIDEWRETPAATYTAEVNLPEGGAVPVQVDYFESRGGAQIHVEWTQVSGAGTTGPVFAQYWNNVHLAGDPVLTRSEQEVNYNWGQGSPAPGVVNTDNFSARWTRNMNLLPGEYEFTVRSDDGVRLWVGNELLIDAWHPASGVTYKATTDLPGGVTQFRIEYYEQVGQAFIYVNGTRLTDIEFIPPGGGGGGGDETDPDKTAVITASYLNVRSGPGVEFDVVTVVEGGTQVELTGYRDSAAVWVQILLPDGTVGWVSRSYIETDYPIEELEPPAG